ncbi:MAG TPA: enoyl-CoA hydratase-related protein [Burkholderiales bacterium]|jgi:Enoyl-CoA hydratase/carnithine racemase
MARKNTNSIDVEVRNGVAIVWLNRPAVYNALDERMTADLLQVLEEVESDRSLRALILAGRGEAFSAGGDIEWMQRMGQASASVNEKNALAITRLFHALHTCSVPTIARVHGQCFGGGVGFVAACDIVVASTDAEFACAEVKRGLVPAGISPYVSRAIGARNAQRYLLSGERFDAAEAYRMGLVHEICQPDLIDNVVNALLGHLIAGSPAAQRTTKALLRGLNGAPIDEALIRQSAKEMAKMRASAEAQEGMSAFLEKRDPAWIDGARGKTARKKTPAKTASTKKGARAKR